jgi:hypothetical protein
VRQLINQHSYIVVAIVALTVIWFVAALLRGPVRWITVGLMVVVLAAAAIWFRTGPGDVLIASDLDGALASGEPVLLEFYSNY